MVKATLNRSDGNGGDLRNLFIREAIDFVKGDHFTMLWR